MDVAYVLSKMSQAIKIAAFLKGQNNNKTITGEQQVAQRNRLIDVAKKLVTTQIKDGYEHINKCTKGLT